MIPPNLLAELRKQAVIEYYKDGSEKPNSFLLGAEVLWSRLCELSEDDHSENDLLKAFGQLESERYQLTDFYGGELCYFTEGWKRSAALFQAALLKAREKIARLKDTPGGKRLYGCMTELAAERARAERLEEKIKFADEFIKNNSGSTLDEWLKSKQEQDEEDARDKALWTEDGEYIPEKVGDKK